MATEAKEVKTEHPYVTRLAGVLGGSPIVGGRRIPVWHIADSVRQGRPVEQVVAEYEGRLSPAAVYDAISYYYDHREEIDHEIWLNTSDEALAAQLRELGAYQDERGAIRFRRAPGQRRQH
ncbi:MAG: DUF433 domain-containing protein [Chloroflexi bacterium]|nr:DUF433 domain-containing protein [Chloroflexota bacterium]